MSLQINTDVYQFTYYEAELARIKAEMEAKIRAELLAEKEAKEAEERDHQEREAQRVEMERIHQEMEATIRQEIEKKMRMEMEMKEKEQKAQEERRRNEKEQRELETIKDKKHMKLIEVSLDFIRKERVLFCHLSYDIHNRGSGGDQKCCIFINDARLAICRMTRTSLGSREEILPLYEFDNPLTMRDIRILDQLFHPSYQPDPLFGNIPSPLPDILVNCMNDPSLGFGLLFARGQANGQQPLTGGPAFRRFESILRLIPGSYRNGSWKPLDGFFGVYFNEETLELSSCAPPMI